MVAANHLGCIILRLVYLKGIILYGCFQKYGHPKMDGFYMEYPIKMDDLGIPPFKETPMPT